MTGIVTSLLLPWVCGMVWVHWLLRSSGRCNGFLVAGHGYLLGVFLATLLIRVWSATGLPLHYWSLAATIVVLTLTGLAAIRAQVVPTRHARVPYRPTAWELAVTALFLALILYRYATILQELLLRPLFAWDVWMNWAPKAIVWYHYNELLPWVSIPDWLSAPGEALAYTAGASDAWKYPETIPLIQLWGMIAMGTSDHTLIYLPWFLVALALGLALYGHLRLSGSSVVTSTLACYLLMNLPFINVHAALAGYADIWVTAAFGCAVFALHEWGDSRRWQYAVLALLLAAMCTQLKIPGIILGGIVCTVLLISLRPLNRRVWLVLAAAFSACLLYVACFGLDLDIPGTGRLVISGEGIMLPYIGYYEFAYHPVSRAMINTTLVMTNWHLLWYVFILLGVATIIKGKAIKAPSLLSGSLLLALLFILFVYYFTNRYLFALDYTQVNRALIYTTPLLVVYIIHASGSLLTTSQASRLTRLSRGTH